VKALARSLNAWDAAALLAVLGADYALKSFASHAGARELGWLLAPTAALVTRLSGHAFGAEAGAGYVSRDLFVVIAPVCSGINFLIIAFSALTCGFVTSFVTPAHKWVWTLVCAPLAYAATIAANALRITLALGAGRSLSASGVLSPGSAHRALGIAVYLACLLGLHAAIGAVLSRRSRALRFASARLGWVLVPLASYLAVTVVIPVLHGRSSHVAFGEHTMSVAGAAGCVIAVLWLASTFAALIRRTLGRVVEGTLGPSGVRRLVALARRGGERPLSGRGDATLVPPVH
jgi:exosortase K